MSGDLVSVLMPTREDVATIGTALRSLIGQTHARWEVIVVDDNPNDETRSATRAEVEALQLEAGDRIRYIRGSGDGQLSALNLALPDVRGDFVTMLHSDDLIVDPRAFERIVAALRRGRAVGAFSDLALLDAQGRWVGRRSCRLSPALVVASGGSNALSDIFFTTKEAFERHIVANYITWNVPYYLSMAEGGLVVPDLARIDPPWYGYRLADVPYRASEGGLFDKVNGELRTLARTWKARLCVAPSWARGHAEIARALDRLGLLRLRAEAHRGESLRQFREGVQRKRRSLARRSAFLATYFDRVLRSVDDRAAHDARHPARRELVLDDPEGGDVPVYLGRDAPRFFREARDGLLPPLMADLYAKEYDRIVCRGPEARRKMEAAMQFLGYLTPIEEVHRPNPRPEANLDVPPGQS